jgi:ABC-type Zn uptake system ZnuABC Zn-binding protein ZnuA
MYKRQVMRLGVVASIALCCLLWVWGCGAPRSPWNDVQGGSKHVLVSFTPLYCFTKSVAGPDAKVLSLLTTVGPHDYQPSAADALTVRRADLFFINGLGLDEFVKKLVNNSGNRGLSIVEVGEAIPEKQLLNIDEDEHNHKAGEGHHHHGEHDPHVWLGLPEAVKMVNCIRDNLCRIDPDHEKGYTDRAKDYVKELEDLRKYGEKELGSKKNPRFIATHDSLRYFARSFDIKPRLEIVGNIQVRAGVSTDAAQLKELAALAKEKDVRVIAIEPQYVQADTEAKALIREMGPQGTEARIIEIDPLETVPHIEDLDGGYYIRKMKANIDALAKALQ